MISDTSVSTSPELNEEEIIEYYEKCQVDYEICWHLSSYMSMHYGYWTKKTKTLRSSLNQMNLELIKEVSINRNDYVLDAGCGVGGSSIYLAKNIGCKVKGITLTPSQVEKSTENAIMNAVDSMVSFEKQNYLSTRYDDDTFDVVWAIESVCYAYDKLDFIKEAYRILKPGGRLVVADFYAEKFEDGSKDEEIMEKWTDSWAIKSYATTEEFINKCSIAGFSNTNVRNITKNVLPSIKRLYYYFFPGLIVTTVSEALGFRNKVQTKNTWSTYYQYRAYKRGLWRYNIISSTKPLKATK